MCVCVFVNVFAAAMPWAHIMWLPIVRVQDWRALCHPDWPSQIPMTFVFTSCLWNVAWCCLICGMCLLLTRPFVGGKAEPGQGVCPAQSGRAWGCFWSRHGHLERWRAQTLFGIRVPEIITSLSAFTQHISLGFSVKRLFITSVLKV